LEEDDDAEENMRCKRRGASSPMGFFFLFFGGEIMDTWRPNIRVGGRRGAANCPKDFFSGKKGTQSPYFKEKQKKSETRHI
jgi:hypothetical protein